MTFFHPRWPVFYEDNHLLVLYKPAGLIMQRDAKDKPNLIDLARLWIKQRYDKPGQVFVGMVHRLDAPVAGVLMLARTSKAAGRLSAQLRKGRIVKTYLAVVQGCPAKQTDRLVNHLRREGRYSRIAAPDAPDSQFAALSYEVMQTHQGQSLLRIRLETGRRHQIRAQLGAMGCPILGDRPYGAGQAMADGRIALMAQHLTLTHPTLNTEMRFETPAPEGWPWISDHTDKKCPFWTIEEYQRHGLRLPVLSI